jgi:membrane fusion protein, multidrug efflux system
MRDQYQGSPWAAVWPHLDRAYFQHLSGWMKLARKSRVALFLVLIAVVAAGAYYYRFYYTPQPEAQAATAQRAERAQPVIVAQAIIKPMPREFDTVGRVQTMASIAIRSRIDGVIEKVSVTEGQEVKAGDTIFVFDTRQLQASLRQAQANRAKDISLLEQARRELARLEPLAQRDYATKSALDQQQTNVSSLEATVSYDDAAIESLNVQITYATITAPINGRIGSIASKAGTSIKANDTPLITINQIKPIFVSFSVPQRYLPAIQEGMRADQLPVIATVPDLANVTEKGTVAYTDNAVDATTNTLSVWANFPNQDLRLWPGLYVNVSMMFGTQPDAVVVPVEAVQAGQNGSFVFLIRPDMTAEMRPITVDRVIGGEAVLAQGLTGDENVVIDGQLRLSDGTKVTISTRGGGVVTAPDEVADKKLVKRAEGSGPSGVTR